MNFGERLKKIRTERGLRQEDIGKIVHVGKSTVSQWESGIHAPDLEIVTQLANFLGVSIDYLLGRTDDPRPHKSDDKYAWLSKLSPHLREALEKDIDKYAPYFRILEKATLNDLSPMTLDAIVEAVLEGRRRDEEARLRKEREQKEKE